MRYWILFAAVASMVLGFVMAGDVSMHDWNPVTMQRRQLVMAVVSSYLVVCFFALKRQNSDPKRHRVRLIDVMAFTTSLCIQLAIQQAIRG